ncbi:hypothetical protein FKV24_012060 [Lysobacter maris]|uniref:Uncharacterized protein n=1 Tax=Marilutibacter maris TaxID=1605891 RepID=A0A508ALI6_9GAMM|nr:hypothetical protein FKV24_012060 [Lysobacter maris]
MRHLLSIDIFAALQRGRSVEQFLGSSPSGAGHIRHVELRPSGGLIEIWVYDVEDIGDEGHLDLYTFPNVEPDGPSDPAATFPDPQAAVAYASASLAADSNRWVNLGVAQSEYLDYVRAGRPSRWPVAANNAFKPKPLRGQV